VQVGVQTPLQEIVGSICEEKVLWNFQGGQKWGKR